MADSFFEFDTAKPDIQDTSFNEEEDDTDYDALNNETFGEHLPCNDWEEAHEKLVFGADKRFDDVNKELEERIASFVLDDEGEEAAAKPAQREYFHKTTSANWWSPQIPSLTPTPDTWWDIREPRITPYMPNGGLESAVSSIAKAAKIMTVEELEKTMRIEAEPKKPGVPLAISGFEEMTNCDMNTKAQGCLKKIYREHPSNMSNGGIYARHSMMQNSAGMGRGFVRGWSMTNDSMPEHQNMLRRPHPPFPGNQRLPRPGPPHSGPMYGRPPRDHRQLCSPGLGRPPHDQMNLCSPGLGRPPHDQRNLGSPGLRRPPHDQRNLGSPGLGRSSHDQRNLGSPGLGRPPHDQRNLGSPGRPPHSQRNLGSPGLHRPYMPDPQLERNQFYPTNQQAGWMRQGPPPTVDDYKGLMTPQEKQWLVSIQMMQLNTSQPFVDDYYYTTNLQRQQGNNGRKMGNQNHKNLREQTTTKQLNTYTPLQFENSLGKLQIGSVTAPRKIIDMDVVENFETNTKNLEKKSRQILMEIEEMFALVIRIEDTLNPHMNPSGKLEIDLEAIQEKIFTNLLVENKLISVMSIRKGKKMVLRMLPILPKQHKIIEKLLQDLVPITRKDSEQHLLSFLPSIRNYLATVSLKTLVEIASNYETPFLLSNKFMVSVVAAIVERAELMIHHCSDEEVRQGWFNTLVRLADATDNYSHIERPVVAVERESLKRHLSMVHSRAREDQLDILLLALSNPATTRNNTPML